MNTQFPESIVIVLVEPQSPGNIGMVCRAMKNMGMTRLRLVNGCDRFHPESLKFAVSAKDLLERAELFPDLRSALADISLTIATTRRHGKYRQEIYSPPEIASILAQQISPSNSGAIVFGREDNGLSTDELSLCRWHATIPTSDACGSLNLAQAVLLFCYELFRAASPLAPIEQTRELAPGADLEQLFDQMKGTFLKIGFLNGQNPEHIMRSLRRVFFRAELDSRETAILRGILTQVEWAAGDFDGRKRS